MVWRMLFKLIPGKKLSTIASETLQKRIDELETALATAQSQLSADTHPLLRYQDQLVESPNSPKLRTSSSDPIRSLSGPGEVDGELETQTGHLTLGEKSGSSRYLGEAGPAYLYVSGHKFHIN